jgi:hypothetical protein
MSADKSVTANFIALSALQFVPVTACQLVDIRGGGPTPGGTSYKTLHGVLRLHAVKAQVGPQQHRPSKHHLAFKD